jgi:hypothetical protein
MAVGRFAATQRFLITEGRVPALLMHPRLGRLRTPARLTRRKHMQVAAADMPAAVVDMPRATHTSNL